MKGIYLLIYSLFLFIGCNVEEVYTDDTDMMPVVQRENIAGTYNRTIEVDDITRKYIVYVPESAAGIEEVPVLFVIHGTNQSGQVFYNKPDLWNAKADQEGFIVVYPTAKIHCHFDAGQQRTVTKWAAGDLGETDVSRGALPLCPNETLANDLHFFDDLIHTIKSDYAVNVQRFYATGFSNGAQMTARLAAQRSEVFAAVTLHAGNLSQFIPAQLSPNPLPTMLTFGSRDHLLLAAAGRTSPIPIEENSILIPVIKDGIVQPFLELGGLNQRYIYGEQRIQGVDVAQFRFSRSNVGQSNDFRFILIDKLGHSYVEGLVDPYWSFLERHSL